MYRIKAGILASGGKTCNKGDGFGEGLNPSG
jgi:hypothetical protein